MLFIKKVPGFFAEFEEFLHGQLVLGDPALFRFNDSAVIVTEAIIEDERFELEPASGVITKLRYIGEQALNGEALPYPCYEGCLQYKENDTLRPYATVEFNLNGIHSEQVNPIKLWIINDFTISLRSPTDDGLYVNRKWRSITDKKPPKRKALDKREPHELTVVWRSKGSRKLHKKKKQVIKEATESAFDYCNPDYYSYKVISLSEVKNV